MPLTHDKQLAEITTRISATGSNTQPKKTCIIYICAEYTLNHGIPKLMSADGQ